MLWKTSEEISKSMTYGDKKDISNNFAVSEVNREKEDVCERLRAAVKNAGGNQHVAAASGVPLASLNSYIAGREMKAAVASRLADACGVSLEWLVTGRNTASDTSSQPVSAEGDETSFSDSLVEFDNYDIVLSAGHGYYPSGEKIQRTIHLQKSLLPNEITEHRKHVCALTVRGDSMQPSLDDGDLVLIRTDVESIKSGAIYAIRIDNSLLVKRLRLKANGNVEVVSDNPSYSTDELKAAEIRQMIRDGGTPAKIIGRVVWRSGAMTV